MSTNSTDYRVLLAANHTLPVRLVANHLLKELASLPMEATVLLRRPREGNPAAFELLAAQLCVSLGISVDWRMPDEGRNRAGTYERDVTAVRSADLVICYFDPATIMESGTGHIAQRAIEEDRLCQCYTVDESGAAWLGSIEKESVDTLK